MWYFQGKSGSWYPRVKFKLSTREPTYRSAILVEIDERLPKKFQRRLPDDYWDFIPKRDAQQEESCKKDNKMILYPHQVKSFINVYVLVVCVTLTSLNVDGHLL